MNSRLRRPAGALLATVLAASVLGITPAAHAANGTISGVVTGSGGPLSTVSVNAWVHDGESWSYFQDGYASTDDTGNYSLSLPPGDYRIGFYDHSGDHVEEFFEDAPTVEAAGTITVGDSGSIDLDATLATAAHITGRVSDTSDGALEGISVAAYQEKFYEGQGYWEAVQYDDTDAAGLYDLGGLVAGTYRVKFEDGADDATYGAEFYDNTSNVLDAQGVTVDAAGRVGDIDAQLALESTISGSVTDVSGLPLELADAYAYVQAGDDWEYVDVAETDASGDYTFDGLGAGNYRVSFGHEVAEDYLFEAWNDKGSLYDGDDIVISTPRAATGIDAQLIAGEHDIKYVEGVTLPTISGTAQVGSTLTATAGTWTPAAVTATYQWFRGEEAIAGATAPSYTLTAADQGKYMWVGVVASYPDYEDRFNMSDVVGPVAAAPVAAPVPTPVVAPVPAPAPETPALAFPKKMKVKGALKVGKKLVLKKYKVTTTDAKVTYKIRWYAGKKKIKKATKAKLKLTRALKGKKISVKITAKSGSTSKKAKLKLGRVR